MKKILVPCDFSRQSTEAFKVALEIAAKSKGELVLLYALPIPTLYTTEFAGEPLLYDPVYFARMEEDAKKELKQLQRQAASKSIKASAEIAHGELISSIKANIETNHIDIVIMGTSGASGYTEMFVGSNTEKVVRSSPVPVLAVRQFFELESIKNILLPSTLDLNQTAFITRIKEVQHFFRATLHILLINTPTHFRKDAEAHEALEEFARHYKLTHYKSHFRNYRNEDDGIIDFASAEKMDLIAMATHARKGLSHLFNGSVTESVVNHIQSPIWTCSLKG